MSHKYGTHIQSSLSGKEFESELETWNKKTSFLRLLRYEFNLKKIIYQKHFYLNENKH